MNFSERFTHMISELNMTNRQFAKEIGVTESYISNIRRGHVHSISRRLADFIEDKYGYHAHWILKGSLPVKLPPNRENLQAELMACLRAMDGDDIQAFIHFIHKMDVLKDLLLKHPGYRKPEGTAPIEP